MLFSIGVYCLVFSYFLAPSHLMCLLLRLPHQTKSLFCPYLCFLLITHLYILLFPRRTNEIKSDIDIPEDVVQKFKQFWSDFKDAPLKGYFLPTPLLFLYILHGFQQGEWSTSYTPPRLLLREPVHGLSLWGLMYSFRFSPWTDIVVTKNCCCWYGTVFKFFFMSLILTVYPDFWIVSEII